MKKIILQSEDGYLVGTWVDGDWTLAFIDDRIQPKYTHGGTLDADEFETRVSDAIKRYDDTMKYIKAENFYYR